MMEFILPKNKKLIEIVGEQVTSDKAFYQDIEETAQLPKGYTCAVNRKGVKLYFKLGKKTKEGVELIPLTKEELKGLDIEETANDNLSELFNIEIEEIEG
jgi:hypothetical protein